MSNYVCCICGRPANVKYTQVINGQKKVAYYCEECAQMIDKGVDIEDLFKSLFNQGSSFLGSKTNNRVCKCGMTEQDILQGGKFGCAECYNVFGDIANEYIKSRGYLDHKGSSPLKTNKPVDKKTSELEKLQRELDKAVNERRYLDADKISKQINDLQAKEE